MSQPLDRMCSHPPRGKIDHELGEFWFDNPFQMPTSGANLSAYEPNRLFMNIDGERFLDASFASAADIDADSRSVCVADFDQDARPDLLVASAGGGPLRLFLNRMEQGNRLDLELHGRRSNRAGIGARIIAEAGGRRVVRDIFPANGFRGTSPPDTSIGLGSAEKIERLEIRWPSGLVQKLRDVPAGQLLVREGESR